MASSEEPGAIDGDPDNEVIVAADDAAAPAAAGSTASGTEIELVLLATLLERWMEPIRIAWSPIAEVAVRLGDVVVDPAAARAVCDVQPDLRIGFELTLGDQAHHHHR